MHIVKVRRVGNSNVITLPKELEASGYVAGTSVLIDLMPDGRLEMGQATSLHSYQWRALAERVVAADREALDKPAAYDRRDLSDQQKNALVRRVVAEIREALGMLAAYDRGETVADGAVCNDTGHRPAT